MNIAQAKRLVSLSSDEPLATPEALEQAIQFCDADIADALRGQDAARVASLRAAKEIFTTRAQRMSRHKGPGDATGNATQIRQQRKAPESGQLKKAKGKYSGGL